MIRHTLVARQLGEHLPRLPTQIVDIGGGAGHQAIPLARKGYEVTILDPSRTMLREARRSLASEEESVRWRVRMIEGAGERAREVLGEESFDAVLCHGVLPYLDDPYPLDQDPRLSSLSGRCCLCAGQECCHASHAPRPRRAL